MEPHISISSWWRPTLKVQHLSHDVTYFALIFVSPPVLIRYVQTKAEKVTHAARHHHGCILSSRANLSLSWTQAVDTTTVFNPTTEASSSASPHISTRRGAHFCPHSSHISLRHRPLPSRPDRPVRTVRVLFPRRARVLLLCVISPEPNDHLSFRPTSNDVINHTKVIDNLESAKRIPKLLTIEFSRK